MSPHRIGYTASLIAVALLPAAATAAGGFIQMRRLLALRRQGVVMIAVPDAVRGSTSYAYPSPAGYWYQGEAPGPVRVVTMLPRSPRVHAVGSVTGDRVRGMLRVWAVRLLAALAGGASLALFVHQERRRRRGGAAFRPEKARGRRPGRGGM